MRRILCLLCRIAGIAGLVLCSSCRSSEADDIAPDMTISSSAVYLSFYIDNQALEIPPKSIPTRTTGVIEPSTPTTGSERGVQYEQQINNVWILLYSKGADDASSVLKYNIKFTPDGPYTGYDSPDATISKLYVTANNGAAYTSVKAIEKGVYRAVIMTNTTQGTRNLMAEMEQKGIANYQDFKAAGQAITPLSIGTEMPRTDMELTSQGIFASAVDDNFSLNEINTTPENPMRKIVSLTRFLSKLRVTFTNADAAGTIYPNSKAYQLVRAEIKNYYPSARLFAWNTTEVPATNTGDAGMVAFDQKGSFFNAFKSSPLVTAQQKISLLNFYLMPYNNLQAPQNANNFMYLELTLSYPDPNDASKRMNRVYQIPIKHSDANRTGNEYIDVDKFSEYTIRRNTLYELNLSLQGAEIVTTTISYQVQPWDVKTVTLPPFN